MDYSVEYLPEGETDLREFLGTPNPFFEYLRAIKTEMPGGANIVGRIAARIKALIQVGGLDELADMLTYAPGDRTLNFGDADNPAKVGLGAPIAYDIWYLFHAGNVLKFGGKSQADSMEKMAGFFSSVDGAKPLRPPVEDSSDSAFMYPFSGASAPSTLFSSMSAGDITAGSRSAEYAIKECRFEVYLAGNGAAYDSVGPAGGGKNDLAGYVAVPIGPLGAMWRISLATESSLSNGTGADVHPVGGNNGTIPGGDLLPPFDISKRETCGEMMMNKGYILDDETTCELMAEGFGDDPKFHKWLRYWIKKKNTTIVPGEFVGILCRPWPLHCWWHQETAPIVYAGNWVETEFYACGVVKEVIDPEDGEVGNRYRVWVKNEEITVKSSDFLEYEVDEKVGLLKSYRDGRGGASYGGNMAPAGPGGGTTNFSWRELSLQNTGEELNTEWVIVPVDFYGATGGSNAGGA